MFTYEDYLRSLGQWGNHASSEAGSSNPLDYALSREQWAAMNPTQQIDNSREGYLSIMPGDPRYGALAEQTGAEEGRMIHSMSGEAPQQYRGVNRWNDPSQVQQGNGFYTYAENNETPEYQKATDPNLARKFGISALAMIGGLAAGGALAGGAAAGGATGGTLGAAGGQGFGTTLGLGSGYGAGGMVGAGAGGSLASSGSAAGASQPGYPNMAEWTTGDPTGQTGLLGGGADGGALSALDLTPMEPFTPPTIGTMTPSNTGFLNSVMAGDFGGAANAAGSWAMNNPLQALGAAQTVGGMLGGGSNSGGSQAPYNPRNLLSGNKGGQGGPVPQSTNQGFYVNPYTLAQLQAYGG